MTEPKIHPTAQVANSAKLGERVIVGPFAVIEDDVILGDDCIVHAHAIIHRLVKFGNNNQVYPHAVIGGLPQDLSFDPDSETFVRIGDNNTFREGTTVNRATRKNSSTRIGCNCFFMNNSHMGHDCVIGDNNVLATGATLGGHVLVGDGVFFGGGVMVHQFCRIGSLVMIRGTTGVSMDVIPYTMVGGVPARHYRLNTVGLRRAGIVKNRYKMVSQAFRLLRNRQTIDGLEATQEILRLREWLSGESKRGIHGFATVKSKTKGI